MWQSGDGVSYLTMQERCTHANVMAHAAITRYQCAWAPVFDLKRHNSFSPDLAPYNLFLFPPMKSNSKTNCFGDTEEIKRITNVELAVIQTDVHSF